MTIGEMVEILYPFYLEELGDEELAACATSVTINELLWEV